ncbi:MAG: hypothetical protein IT357_07650 [Gemmatimonadaceae bacterium]|nr:hypothetical protein [Gemmatimonadaceae bacterium]
MPSPTPPHRPHWPRVLGAILIAQVMLIAGAVAWVAIYSYLIAPGQSIAAYQAHAQVSGPWVSLVLGIPVFFGLGRWLARHRPEAARASAIALGVGYVVVDLAILLAAAQGEIPWGMVAANYVVKLSAAWFGAMSATQRSSTSR